MDNKILIIDFNDSFTYNIASLFLELGFESQVMHWRELLNHKKEQLTSVQVIVWGPGPGHVNDYKELFPFFKELLEDKNFYHFGVCLGHQLIGIQKGYLLSETKNKRHGISEQIELNDYYQKLLGINEITVQFYNSLVLQNKTDPNTQVQLFQGDVVAISSKNSLSYQFHPESVGTSCPEALLAPVLRILYNKQDGDFS